MKTMTVSQLPDPAPLVTREALKAFTERLVEHFAPEQVILFGSQVRGEARWDSDADILVVMPFEGSSFERRLEMLEVANPAFPVDLLLCRPEAARQRYGWGDPFIREALDHGEQLHGELNRTTFERPHPSTPVRNLVVDEWIARAERHWRMAELLPDLPPGYLSGLFQVQRCLETYLRAALIAQDIPSRKCRDLLILSNRLAGSIPGWQPDPATLNTLTQAAEAYLDPGEGDPEPSKDTSWALAEAEPLRDCLRRWFASLEAVELQGAAHGEVR